MIVYTLKLAQGRYYVGRTNNLSKRLQDHQSGIGSAWTRLYPVIKLLEARTTTNPFDETAITLSLMQQYGISNVRGGPYVQIELSQESIQTIQKEFWAANDKCFKCGGSHFVNACKMRQAQKQYYVQPKKKRQPKQIPFFC